MSSKRPSASRAIILSVLALFLIGLPFYLYIKEMAKKKELEAQLKEVLGEDIEAAYRAQILTIDSLQKLIQEKDERSKNTPNEQLRTLQGRLDRLISQNELQKQEIAQLEKRIKAVGSTEDGTDDLIANLRTEISELTREKEQLLSQPKASKTMIRIVPADLSPYRASDLKNALSVHPDLTIINANRQIKGEILINLEQ